jgi:plasmid maintenance system killer protein
MKLSKAQKREARKAEQQARKLEQSGRGLGRSASEATAATNAAPKNDSTDEFESNRAEAPRGNIASFKDKQTRAIFHGEGGNTKALRRLDKSLWPVAQRTLEVLANTENPMELAEVHGNGFEKMRDDKYKDEWSIRINEQHRVHFKQEDGKFTDVFIVDHHRG